MVVFDASGSMWGQIEGLTKIELAREVFNDLSGRWDAQSVNAGLIAYGHRRKGDCSDIELISTPAPGASLNLGKLVQELVPKGKTPLSAAVKMAAEQLRFTEERATVILLSDGKETCQLDPCAVGQELERLGVDFTAHVVGFDVAAPEDKAQLECLAANTGGKYFDVSDAEGLTKALTDVTQLDADKISDGPIKRTISLSAILEGDEISQYGRTVWVFNSLDGQTRTQETEITNAKFDLAEGEYQVGVSFDVGTGQAQGEASVKVERGGQTEFTIWAKRPEVNAELALLGTPRVGEDIRFKVGLANIGSDDRIRIVPRGGKDEDELLSAEAQAEVAMLAVLDPGEYDALYVADAYSLRQEVVRLEFTLAPVDLHIIELGPVTPGAPMLQLSDGGRAGDMIVIRNMAEEEVTSIYAEKGQPFALPADLPPGDYILEVNRDYQATYYLGGVQLLPESANTIGEDDDDAVAPIEMGGGEDASGGEDPSTMMSEEELAQEQAAAQEQAGSVASFDFKYNCVEQAICGFSDPRVQLNWSMAKGWSAEEPYFYTTAGGTVATHPTLVLVKRSDDPNPFIVALNQRMWDAKSGPCIAVPRGELCRNENAIGDERAQFEIIATSLREIPIGYRKLSTDDIEEILTRIDEDNQ
ncbi:vWA domain-containing protein [Maritalea sp.]|uniref:vWA domain-containing protein n=1 Tax=Maritalea sp. TaxID=2003361 RepID=UPI003EF7D0B6